MIRELTDPDDLDAAREVALRMLTATARTCGQIRSGLIKRGYSESTIDELIERLVTVGLLDDLAYSQSLVRTRRDVKGASRRGIAAELARKGVEDQVIADALAEYPFEDEDAIAYEEALRRVRRLDGSAPEVMQRRVFAALARKGYSPAVAHSAVVKAMRPEH